MVRSRLETVNRVTEALLAGQIGCSSSSQAVFPRGAPAVFQLVASAFLVSLSGATISRSNSTTVVPNEAWHHLIALYNVQAPRTLLNSVFLTVCLPLSACIPQIHTRYLKPKMSSTAAFANSNGVEIVDIHQNDMEFSLVDDIHKQLDPPDGSARSFPTLLLYDAKGLKLFEKITYLDDYYLTNAEIDVLTTNAKRIVERIPKNAQLLELGSGSVVLALRIRGLEDYT